MTENEIKKKLEKINREYTFISFGERLTSEDYKRLKELQNEETELLKKLEQLER